MKNNTAGISASLFGSMSLSNNARAAEDGGEVDAFPATGANEEGKQSKGVVEHVVNTKVVCRVCKHFYRDPKILPCLHTFCAECIRQLEPFSVAAVNGKDVPSRDSSRRRDQHSVTVLCPECDSEVDLPRAGVDGLTTDHLVLDEVFLETLLSENYELVCDLCNEGDAEKRCAVCSANLCEFCCQAHRRQKKTSSHSVQRLRDLKAQGRLVRPVLCPLHPGEELRLFCDTCELALCRDCAATTHRSHQCGPAGDVVHRHGDRIRQLLRGVHPRLARLEEALRGVERSQHALGARAEGVAREVEHFCGGYVRAVEAHCRSLLARVEAVRAQRRAQLHLQRAQLEQALADARTGVDFAERLLTCGTEVEILSAKGVVTRRLATLAEDTRGLNPASVTPDDANLCFVPQESAGEVGGYTVFGVIHAKTVDPSKCVIQGEDRTDTDLGPVRILTVNMTCAECPWDQVCRTVLSNPASPGQDLLSVWGTGLQRGREGQRGEFTLVCRDSSGEPMGKGGEAVMVSIVHKEKKDCVVEATVADNGDGSYSVSYTPAQPGPYSIWVCVKAQHVKGSPFVLAVRRKFRRHRGMFHCCSFCSSGGVKEARCGCGGSMPGGYQGCGHGHKGHPGKPHWSCCGSVLEGSECTGPGSPKASSGPWSSDHQQGATESRLTHPLTPAPCGMGLWGNLSPA
ncbi:hypothetical protein AAFF_G00279990 [Aldrovandia affinis]|uniref:RING-type E3 ubiquitin transferase n=1 Tax=Aldrovandia affinis TaxID=143900 RepID=A0AAD7SRR1_9TELE|nr:hypothetical protein AAFF_G00279990 [Aldrovandia affinis]